VNLPRRVERIEARAGELLRVRAVRAAKPIALDMPADVLALIAEQVNAVRADRDADPLDQARTLGFLATVALRTMEARDLSARLEAVERVLKLRRDQERETQKQQRT
jgi:hypothetical protein